MSKFYNTFCPIDKTQLGTTSTGYSEPGSDGNERVLHIPQSSSITEASPSDCLVLSTGYSWGRSCTSAEMQSVYSTTPVDWATLI